MHDRFEDVAGHGVRWSHLCSEAVNAADIDEARSRAAAHGIVIIGAGQAGGRAAETLRAEGFTGAITLLGDEVERPYERPSLSKEMLLDTSLETIAWLHDRDFYKQQDIALRLGISAIGIDRAVSRVNLSDGKALPYGALILATGARARKLDVAPSDPKCFYVRSLEDSRALRHRFGAGHRVVIIGAGFIGLEVAAAAIVRQCHVAVIELGKAPLGRVAPGAIQDFYRRLHEGRGVTFRFGAQVADVVENSDMQFVRLADGEVLTADTIVVGIGAIPNDGIAMASGLACSRGIIVDAFGSTEDPSIFAVGDVARHYNPLLGRELLLESWQNAQNQAIAIARNLARPGDPAPYAELPWFWSDQYDVNLQIYGLAHESGEHVLRGDPTGKSWQLYQIKAGKIVFAAGINAARDLRAIRDLMKSETTVDPQQLADMTITTAELLRRARSQVSA